MSDNYYILKHKDDPCALLSINESGQLLKAGITNPSIAPYLGHANEKLMRMWWESRAVPASRSIMQDVIRASGCTTPAEYLAKNLALSVTDVYWICPIDSSLTWNDVDIRNMVLYNEGKIPYHNATSYDPNASLGGQMDKYWDLNGEQEILVKEAYAHYGQQAANEAFATMVHTRQETDVPFVHYTIQPQENGLLSRCKAFTSESVEFIPAYEILQGIKHRQSLSEYDEYIRICTANGIPQEEMQRFMDYQTLTDFLLTNTDEHLMNFGVLRDTETMRFIAPAPIYDTGNSMFFRDTSYTRPLERHELLQIEITAFHKQQEKMLGHIQNRDIVDLDKLPGKDETQRFYESVGIPEQKAKYIAENYSKKIDLAMDFQQGKKISVYLEEKAYRDGSADC